MKKNKHMYSRFFVLLLCICCFAESRAQQFSNSPVAQYYRNGYLWNPAYAGSNDHSNLYALLNNTWIGFDGAPTLVMLSGDMAFGKNSGGGLRFMSDKSGVLQRTTVAGDYSFTIKFTNTQRLRLGVSLGVYSERVSSSDATDPLVMAYNETTTVADGNLGAVYEVGGFTLGAVAYNLRNSLQKSGSETDMAQAHFMSSYNIPISGDKMFLKPLVAYKLFSQSEGLFSLGTQFEYEKLFNTSLIWQSTGSLIGSIGIGLFKAMEFNIAYGTNNKYGYGQQYEVGIGVRL